MNIKPITSRIAAGHAGFTIVEMLVATSVLVLLVVMVAQLMNGAVMSTTAGRKSMDADTQSRLVFDRMAIDFDKMVKRTDVDYIFYKNYVAPGTSGTGGENDVMFFYSEVPSYYDDTGIGAASQNTAALVGYRIDWQNPYYNGAPVLERLSKGLTWDGITTGTAVAGGPVFLTVSGSGASLPASRLDGNWPHIGSYQDSPPYDGNGDSSDPDYHVLSDRVFRMEIAFQLNDGTISAIPIIDPGKSPPTAQISGTSSVNNLTATTEPQAINDGYTSPSHKYAAGSRWFDTTNGRGFICTNNSAGAAVWNNIGIQDISAVIVAIGVLDDASRKLIAGPNANSEYDTLAGSLVDLSSPSTGAISQTNLMTPTWYGALSSGTFGGGRIPRLASSQIRVYQRYFYLNNLQ